MYCYSNLYPDIHHHTKTETCAKINSIGLHFLYNFLGIRTFSPILYTFLTFPHMNMDISLKPKIRKLGFLPVPIQGLWHVFTWNHLIFACTLYRVTYITLNAGSFLIFVAFQSPHSSVSLITTEYSCPAPAVHFNNQQVCCSHTCLPCKYLLSIAYALS